VVLTDFSSITVFAEFARCLAMFPNLHTLQLLSNGTRIAEPLKVAFEGRMFPSVRTLVFTFPTHPIVACCREARQVTAFGRMASSLPYMNLIFNQCLEKCAKVEVLRGFELLSYHDRNREHICQMIQNFPRTRTMVLSVNNPTLTIDDVRSLSKFPELSCIELYINADDGAAKLPKAIVEAAESVLRGKLGVEGSERRIMLKYLDAYKQIVVA